MGEALLGEAGCMEPSGAASTRHGLVVLQIPSQACRTCLETQDESRWERVCSFGLGSHFFFFFLNLEE